MSVGFFLFSMPSGLHSGPEGTEMHVQFESNAVKQLQMHKEEAGVIFLQGGWSTNLPCPRLPQNEPSAPVRESSKWSQLLIFIHRLYFLPLLVGSLCKSRSKGGDTKGAGLTKG